MDSTQSNPGAEGSSAPSGSLDPNRSPLGTLPDSVRPTNEEGLPELEPLTPELVEDEAVRGDFMLRWSVILLAMLLGWTEVAESLTLVRIKTGEYLASHGWLPPRTDVFSVTAAEQPWLNFSWLGDLLLAGVHGAGGSIALTVLSAVLAGISFWSVSAAARKGVSSWWGSICAALAALAAFPLLRPGPDSLTVLGLALTMLVLMKGAERPDRARYVLLVPLLWLWSNLDGHAFLGAAVVLAYAIGDLIDSRRAAIATNGTLWKFAIGGVLAMLVHPFHIDVARAPLLLYGVEPAEWLLYGVEESEFGFLYLRLVDRVVWQNLNVFTLAGILTAAAALLSLALNRRHARMSHVLTLLATIGLALVSLHALAAAAVVHAVLAAVNAQEWYRREFRQTYSVESSELLFSRGGRAATVIGLFALAYLAVSGRLMGADGRRIGMGFDAELSTTIASLRDVLADSYDDRAFNFNPSQGDVLIWVGQKPFIDSRLGMYGSAQPNIGDLHRKLRLALRQRVPGDDRTGQRAVWHAAFEEYNISHALPRLSGRRPNYETFFDLMSDPEREWRLVRLGAASAAMYWNRPDDKELVVYLAAHPGADFLRQAFPRDETAEDPPALSLIAPPREPSWYDRMLILPQNVISNEVQLARHYIQLRIVLANRISPDNGASITLLAIRHARRGLVSEPNSADAYQTLAACYLGLSELERYLDPTGGSAIGPLRMRQALAALYNAVKCNPDDANAQMTLYQVLLATGKPDLALPHLREVQRITGTLTTLPAENEQAQQEVERNREQMAQLTTQIETVRKELHQSLQTDAENNNRLEVVQGALSRGLPGEALQLLEEDQTIVAQNARVQMLMADLLLDAGRVEDALGQLEPMSAIMLQQNPAVASQWRNATALANIAAGNYERARILLNEDADAATEMRLQSVMGTSPRLGEVPGISTVPLTHAPADVVDMRGISRATLVADLLYGYPQQWNRDQFILAACDIEDGRNRAAVKRLEDILQRDPESELRPITAFYLTTMTGRVQSFTPPSQEIPISGDMFADDAESGPAAESGAAVEATGSDTAPAATDAPALPPPPPSSDRRDAGSTP